MNELLASIRGWVFTLKCKILYKNIQIGAGLKIFKRLDITGNGKIIIGNNCIVDGIKGDPNQYVCINTLSPDALIRIGNNASLYAARLSAQYQVVIGDDVLIEEASIMDTDFHSIDKERGLPTNENKEKCQILIGNRVSIGAKSIVSKGLTIGDDVTVVSGSIVTKSIKPGSVVVGNPARPFDPSLIDPERM